MPLVDLPLKKLRTYRGRTPRPSDFDAYWRASLAELDATPPAPELIPNTTLSSRHAECFDLWLTGAGGARIHAKFLRPKRTHRSKPAPAILQFHGYNGSSGDWADKLAWVNEGFCVAALDCRGQGGLSEDNGRVSGVTIGGHIIRGLGDPDPRNLLFRSLFLDTAQLARVILAMPGVDAHRVGATGGSQGGGLALACAALEPRIKRMTCSFPFLCDYQRVWEMDQAKDAYEELRVFFRAFDPRHEREKEIFTRLGYINCQHLAPSIRAEVIMFTALMDTACPPSTQFAAYNRIKSPKSMVLYPDYRHESLPGQIDRVFNFMLGM